MGIRVVIWRKGLGRDRDNFFCLHTVYVLEYIEREEQEKCFRLSCIQPCTLPNSMMQCCPAIVHCLHACNGWAHGMLMILMHISAANCFFSFLPFTASHPKQPIK